MFITGGYSGHYISDSEVVSVAGNCSKPADFPDDTDQIKGAKVDGAPVVCGGRFGLVH